MAVSIPSIHLSNKKTTFNYVYPFSSFTQILQTDGRTDIFEKVFVFLIDQEEKKKTFLKNVCPPMGLSVRAQNLCTRLKIIEFFFVCLKGVYWESKLRKFQPERTKTYEDKAE